VGSVFWPPIKEARMDVNEKASSESRPLIVAVDDDPAVLQVIETLLTKQDYIVKTALSGGEAFGILVHEIPAVLILDVMMPGPSGYDVCRMVKREARLKNVPVVFLTSRGAPEDFKEGLDLGAILYMTKPFKPQKLLHMVQMLCPRPEKSCVPAEKPVPH
jgi:DNA-binding response OmpR family regulator